MPFQYKKVLLIGATSGIGTALADRFVAEGSFVIAVGRRKENLEAFVHDHGPETSQAISFDITKLEAMPNFAANITNTHPDLDCIVVTSGIQRKADFSDPASIDLDAISLEITTNYLAYLALTKAFLPFLQSKKSESALVFISSGLALIPNPRVSNYCATKAALHQWMWSFREQLKTKSPQIKVIEILPPSVQTELHDEKNQPDIKNGGQIGMSLDDFTNAAYDGLAKGSDQIAVGAAETAFNLFELTRQEAFAERIRIRKGAY